MSADLLKLLQSIAQSISELTNLVKTSITATQLQLQTSHSHHTYLRWRRSGLESKAERSDPVRERLQAMKGASTPSSPVCYQCGNRDHVARYCRNAPLCFTCNQSGHRSFHCKVQSIVDPPLDIPSDMNADAHMESVLHTSTVKEALGNVDSAIVSVKSLLCVDLHTDEMNEKIVTMEVQQEKIEHSIGTDAAMELENGGLGLVCAQPVQSTGKNDLQIDEKSISEKAVAMVFQQEQIACMPSVVSGIVDGDGVFKDQDMDHDKPPDPTYVRPPQQPQVAGTSTIVDKLDNENTQEVATDHELEGAQKENAKKGSVTTEPKRNMGFKIKAMRKVPKPTSTQVVGNNEESHSSNCTDMIEDVFDILESGDLVLVSSKVINNCDSVNVHSSPDAKIQRSINDSEIIHGKGQKKHKMQNQRVEEKRH